MRGARCRGVLEVWNAEFVSLRTGEHNPWLLPLPADRHLADPGRRGATCESASRRRVRGFSAAQIIVTILLTNFNLRKIAAFLSDKIKDDAKKHVHGEPVVRTIRRRDREWHNPYTDTYPAGVMRPDKARHLASDETGGPPLRTQPLGSGTDTAREGKTPRIRDNPACVKTPEDTLNNLDSTHN